MRVARCRLPNVGAASTRRQLGGRGKALRAAALLLLTAGLGGCSHWPSRPEVSAAAQATAEVPGYEGIRLWTDAPLAQWEAWRRAWLQDQQQASAAAPLSILAISSGSDEGAFSAGYLAGWTERGDRPSFSMVTGVSTGALIAPFAFLGPAEDETLRALYTGLDARDVYTARPLAGLTGGPSFADSAPLRRLIARHLTPALLDRIAAEHRRGRRLLIATTNLDAKRGVIWDLGAIAASGAPDRVAVARQIVLASASIPGVFPPVLIRVAGTGRRFSEMHVDGGTTASLFGLPAAVLWRGPGTTTEPPGGSMTILYNGKIAREYEVVQPRAFEIIGRALATLIGESDRSALQAYARFADENDIAFTVAAIHEDFTAPSDDLFDRDYMQRLYEHGRREATGRPLARAEGLGAGATNRARHDCRSRQC